MPFRPHASAQPIAIVPVPAFKDNYLWLVHRAGQAIVVDPGDAAPIEAALTRIGCVLTAIVLTHHHPDHIGGVPALLGSRPSIPVYGPARESIPCVSVALSGGDRIHIDGPDLDFEVLDVPGHTRGHIAYFGSIEGVPRLFCGDTLFACGCGRLFEGTPAQMQASLARLAALPGETLAYCAHEYTLSNIRFARAVEPDNSALLERESAAHALRERGEPTVPFRIDLERATNPFLRWDSPAVKRAAESHAANAAASPASTFAAIRAWKDRF